MEESTGFELMLPKMDPNMPPRRLLSKLRTLWDSHSPATPIYLNAELVPGVTVSDFCVQLLMVQRSRKPKEQKEEKARQEKKARLEERARRDAVVAAA